MAGSPLKRSMVEVAEVAEVEMVEIAGMAPPPSSYKRGPGEVSTITLRLLIITALLDVMSLSLVITTLLGLFEDHGLSMKEYGYVNAATAMGNFLFAPLLGRLSDKVGRVNMLQLSAISSVVSSLATLLCTSKTGFIMARVLPSCLRCSLPIRSAYVSDISHGTERTRCMAMVGSSFGIGFVVGPAVGSLITRSKYGAPAVLQLSALIALVQFLLLFLLPEPVDHERDTSKDSKEPMTLWHLMSGRDGRLLLSQFIMRGTYSLAEFMYYATFIPFLTKELGFQRKNTGLMLSYLGLMATFAQTFIVRRVATRFDEMTALLYILLWQATAWLLWSHASALASVLIIASFLSWGGNCYRSVNHSLISHRTPAGMSGVVMGCMSSVDTLSRAVADALSGTSFAVLGGRRTILMCALVSTVLAAVTGMSRLFAPTPVKRVKFA
jgi:DHA1 family tetracycline resistance protein-like MFS transporter